MKKEKKELDPRQPFMNRMGNSIAHAVNVVEPPVAPIRMGRKPAHPITN